MNIRILLFLLVVPSLGALVTPGGAQERPVTLAEAVEAGRERGPRTASAAARAVAAREAARAAASYAWPMVGLEASAVRSDDPVAAFGGRLRQGRFTQADFDPAGLNHPDPLTDWSGSIGMTWAPLDPSQAAGQRAASVEADASAQGASWARRAAAFQAEARYLEAVGAALRVRAAQAALDAATANLRLMRRRRDQGMLTDADVLQAEAAAAAASAGLIDARRRVADSRERLAVAMGLPAGSQPVPVDTALAGPQAGEGGALAARPDLRASALTAKAAEARRTQAARARLPRLEGFARAESHAPGAFSGLETSWTVGVRIRVPVFTGFRVGARTRAARAMAQAASRDHEERIRRAEAEVALARRAVTSAGERARAAQAAARAADEAVRLVRRRFEEGLATTADLLMAEARAAELSAASTDARLFRRLAQARLRFLTDEDDSPGGTHR